MRPLLAMAVAGFLATSAQAQSQASKTIEGYWQDVAGRITFKRNPLPADSYGNWYMRSLDATYPSAKHIRRAGGSFEIADLNYDEKDYSVRVLQAHERQIDFVRKAKWSPCRVDHSCRLAGEEMLCTMVTVCVEQGKEHVDLRAEERFIRRSNCVRNTTRPEAQGFPVTCN
jgi:hypothetical protein